MDKLDDFLPLDLKNLKRLPINKAFEKQKPLLQNFYNKNLQNSPFYKPISKILKF